MSMVYVAHCYDGSPENIKRAKRIVHELQMDSPQDCFVCPLLTFSHMKYGDFSFDQKMALCLDLLSVCDTLVVASELNDNVQMEVDFANLVGMEVIWLD